MQHFSIYILSAILFGYLVIGDAYDRDPEENVPIEPVRDVSPDFYGIGGNPEKPLPDDPVFDSQEPVDNEPNDIDWKYTVLSTAAIVQVVVVVFYLLISQVCCLSLRRKGFENGYPVKPWDGEREELRDLSERRYLSKDDGIDSDGDFDTDPEELELI